MFALSNLISRATARDLSWITRREQLTIGKTADRVRRRTTKGVRVGDVVADLAERRNGIVVVSRQVATRVGVFEKRCAAELIMPARAGVSGVVQSNSLCGGLGRVHALVDVVVELLDGSGDDPTSTR